MKRAVKRCISSLENLMSKMTSQTKSISKSKRPYTTKPPKWQSSLRSPVKHEKLPVNLQSRATANEAEIGAREFGLELLTTDTTSEFNRIREAFDQTKKLNRAMENETEKLKKELADVEHLRKQTTNDLARAQEHRNSYKLQYEQAKLKLRNLHQQNQLLSQELESLTLEAKHAKQTLSKQSKQQFQQYEAHLNQQTNQIKRDTSRLRSALTQVQHYLSTSAYSPATTTCLKLVQDTIQVVYSLEDTTKSTPRGLKDSTKDRTELTGLVKDNEDLRTQVLQLSQQLQLARDQQQQSTNNNKLPQQAKEEGLIPKYRMQIVKFKSRVENLSAQLADECRTADKLRLELAHYKAKCLTYAATQLSMETEPMPTGTSPEEREHLITEEGEEEEEEEQVQINDKPQMNLQYEVQTKEYEEQITQLKKQMHHQTQMLQKYQTLVESQQQQLASLNPTTSVPIPSAVFESVHPAALSPRNPIPPPSVSEATQTQEVKPELQPLNIPLDRPITKSPPRRHSPPHTNGSCCSSPKDHLLHAHHFM